MRHRRMTWPFMAAILLFTTACGSDTPSQLEGNWILVNADGLTVVAELPDAGISLEVSSSALSGSSGCNTYAADATVEGSSIKVGDLLVTRKACKEAGVMDVEHAYLAALHRTSSWEVASGVLRLQDDETVLVFTRRPDRTRPSS
jgi:heat shock protein HslJ